MPFVTMRAARVLERDIRLYRRSWGILLSGFFEPVFYLLSIGVGIGKLVGHVSLAGGRPVSYTSFVAPALLAAAAMNGAIFDSTFNLFFKLKYSKVFEAALATPVGVGDVAAGETGWSVLRGSLYATAFLLVMAAMGLIPSWWALGDLPAALTESLAFAAVGMAATSFMRSWQDFEFVTLAMLPMFLFSGTFYPLSTYPAGLRVVVEITPLYQGIALLRGLTYGQLNPAMAGHLAYLLVLGGIGMLITYRRLARLLLR
jgi:lipooligosaccharide transport system permease protein